MRFSRVVGLSAGLALAACGSSAERASVGPEPSNDETPAGADGTSPGFTSPLGDAGVTGGGCSEAAKLVYVATSEGDLHSFSPLEKRFTKIGPLNCTLPGKKLTTNSMAVDRQAVAWITMREGDREAGPYHVFKLDTRTAQCSPTKISGTFGGMGFSLDQKGSEAETLFVTGRPALFVLPALSKIDRTAETVVPIANMYTSSMVELTGTGNAELYAFGASSPPVLALLDKATGGFSKLVSIKNVDKPSAFAFSFWGGDFYFFTAKDLTAANTTNVSRYRPSDGSIESAYLPNTGFHIVGAGVSTCAPTTSPN